MGAHSSHHHQVGSDNFQGIQQDLRSNGQLWEDPDFNMSWPNQVDVITEYGMKSLDVIWKRPTEIADSPVFDLSASTVDVDQGELGDCWLLSVMANLTSHKQLFNAIIPPGQNFDSGVFHFHFWNNGRWEEVIIDDRLPCFDDSGTPRLVYTRSNRNEFWASLLEKAFAKLKGGYQSLDSGGDITNAFRAFTGKPGEKIDISSMRNDQDQYQGIHNKLQTSTQVGSLIGAAIFQNGGAADSCGLTKGHAYSIIKADKIHGGTALVLVRNPWGSSQDCEWKGPWSDNSYEWQSVSNADKQRLQFHKAEDGEFWMSIEDFVQQFDQIDLCVLHDKQ